MATARRPRAKKRSCQDCFFHRNMLCALGLDEPCPTFRPYHPDGLKPPEQLSFAFRQSRGAEAALADSPAGDHPSVDPRFGLDTLAVTGDCLVPETVGL